MKDKQVKKIINKANKIISDDFNERFKPDTSKQEHDFVGSHYCLIHKKVEERDSNKETEIWCDDCLEIHPWRV